MKNVLLIAMFALLAAACGKSECEEFGEKLCDLACDCTAGSECKIAQGSLTITHDSKSDCTSFWVGLGCQGGGDENFDFAGCSAALDSATCVDTGDGMGIQYPEVPACMSSSQ
jgi:hypothetical protein